MPAALAGQANPCRPARPCTSADCHADSYGICMHVMGCASLKDMYSMTSQSPALIDNASVIVMARLWSLAPSQPRACSGPTAQQCCMASATQHSDVSPGLQRHPLHGGLWTVTRAQMPLCLPHVVALPSPAFKTNRCILWPQHQLNWLYTHAWSTKSVLALPVCRLTRPSANGTFVHSLQACTSQCDTCCPPSANPRLHPTCTLPAPCYPVYWMRPGTKVKWTVISASQELSDLV